MRRRHFIKSGLAATAAWSFQAALPAWAQSGVDNNLRTGATLTGDYFDLSVDQVTKPVFGKSAKQILINELFPAPLLRWREGDDITLRVNNNLTEDTSIHWHGILLPFQMDGVPGVSFPGIKPGETFTYRFPVKQAGTYWYHSHSNLQEQLGHYGPIIIEPKDADPVSYDREYVVLLSDWTFEDPHRVFAKLKTMSDSYNFQQRTLGDFFSEVEDQGIDSVLADRMLWGGMRMNPTDIADVTGSTYTYLINGHSPQENWTALFIPGEKIRLRFINASAMSIFNIRIPGLPLSIVQADGLNVQPVEVDEFQIGTAETFDVIVTPEHDQAYTFMCESNDRSGYARATLATQVGQVAEVPALRKRPTLTMKDMGMDMGGEMNMGAEMDMSSEMEVNHSANNGAMNHSMMGHDEKMTMPTEDANNMPTMAMSGETKQAHNHARGPGVANVAMNPVNRLSERPLGLEDVGHRVLVYTDLKSLLPNPDQRAFERELELHLTSNMERYMWSFDGLKFSEVTEAIEFKKGERLRLTLVNDTMMAHPIHLHGMFFDVVTEHGLSEEMMANMPVNVHKPRKHTIVAKPGEKLSVDITADAVGDWAFHCHLLYHMHAGMMRVVAVKEEAEGQ